MKTDFLKELGLEQDKIDKIFEEHGKALNAEKALTKKAQDERDGFKVQLDTANASLEKFKEIKPEELQGEIDKLKKDIADKDKEYQSQLADRDFKDLVKNSIVTNKGKSDKAIMALLDLDTLKSSKNQKDDIDTAIKKIMKSDSYLFDATECNEGDGEGKPTNQSPFRVGTGGKHGSSGEGVEDSFISSAMKGAGIKQQTNSTGG